MNKETSQLDMNNIINCFHFGFSEDYPGGYVSITKENAEKLQKHGWTVSFHTDYYLNTLSAEIHIFSIGFASWMENLTAFIETNDYQEIIKINSIEQLDKFLQLIESTMQFENCIIKK